MFSAKLRATRGFMVTSKSKEIQLESYKQNALDRHQLAQEFMGKSQENQAQAEQGGEGQGSQMVKKDAPQHNMRPPEELARTQDQESFKAKWDNEADRAQAMRQEALARYAEQKKLEASKEDRALGDDHEFSL